ncbi:MAG: ABC transporter substrate-binding protein [Acidimicrobiia bacterium]
MKRRLIWISLAVLALAVTVTAVLVADREESEPITVGAVYNTSGGMKWLDQPGIEGLLLAANQINDEGGVLGRNLEVVEVDGTTDTTEMSRLVSGLASNDDIVAIAGVNDPIHAISPIRGALRRADGGLITFSHSEMALAVGRVTGPAGLPFVTAGSTLSSLPDEVGDDLFMVAATHDAEASAAADHAWEELGGRRAWILAGEGRDFAATLASSFQQRWSALGGEIVGTDSFLPGELQISEQIGRLQALPVEPDVIFIASLQNDGGYLVQQLRGAGLDQPILFADVVDPRYIAAMADDVSDVYMASHGTLVDSGDAIREFVAAYEAEYQHAPESATAMLGYDSMRLIADAVERAGSAERDQISQSLAATQDFDALTGLLSYTSNGVPAKTITIMKYQDGAPVAATDIVPH